MSNTKGDIRRVADIADGLNKLAAFVRTHPELAEDLNLLFAHTLVPVGFRTDQASRLASFARAGKASGVEVTKNYDDDWAAVNLQFGEQVALWVYAGRSQVCERIVTGTTWVEKEVVDPGAPKIKQMVPQHTVEWKCSPLLAEVPEREATVAEEVPF